MAIGRLIGTARCCCWTIDSTAVAAAGDDSYVQIISVKDSKVRMAAAMHSVYSCTPESWKCDTSIERLADIPSCQPISPQLMHQQHT